MEDSVINEAAIRAYLLGQLGPEEEMSLQLDERMLTDPEFSVHIDAIEDEILEEYLEGALTSTDIEAVKSHFLTPPERQRKLQRMRLISRHLAGMASGQIATELQPQLPVRSPERRLFEIFPGVRTWAEMAAGLALVSCTIYFWHQQRELRLALMESRQELASSKQAQTGPLTAAQEAAVTLNLIIPGLSRGDQELPEAHLPPNAATLHISVALSAQSEGRLNVRLQQGNAVAWSRDRVETRTVAGGAVLSVDLPRAILPEGACRLIVSVPGRGEISYWFKVSKSL